MAINEEKSEAKSKANYGGVVAELNTLNYLVSWLRLWDFEQSAQSVTDIWLASNT